MLHARCFLAACSTSQGSTGLSLRSLNGTNSNGLILMMMGGIVTSSPSSSCTATVSREYNVRLLTSSGKSTVGHLSDTDVSSSSRGAHGFSRLAFVPGSIADQSVRAPCLSPLGWSSLFSHSIRCVGALTMETVRLAFAKRALIALHRSATVALASSGPTHNLSYLVCGLGWVLMRSAKPSIMSGSLYMSTSSPFASYASGCCFGSGFSIFTWSAIFIGGSASKSMYWLEPRS
mmetsp:Transcript_72786/g.144610  ORF Transcript_72786/g.144610 Transcript_72786/m.144610 type:complete len:233 (+) Transcript_72786:681-1379(+)